MEFIYCVAPDTPSFRKKFEEFIRNCDIKKGSHTLYCVKDSYGAGKYRNCLFFINFDLDGCIKFKVVTVSKELENSFKFGTYSFDGHTLFLKCKISENLVYDYLPALFAEYTFLENYFEKCFNEAMNLSKFESNILKYISKVSLEAVRKNILDLEKTMDELSEYHSQFFSMFSRYRDAVERYYESLMRYENLTREIGIYLGSHEEKLEILKRYEDKFKQTLSGLRDLFSLMSLRLDTLRNREYLELQKKTSSLQMAAIAIEFVAVFYYTMKIWEHFSPKKLPLSIEFILLFLFTTLVVTITDTIGEYMRSKKIGFIGYLTILLLILVLAIMTFLSVA